MHSLGRREPELRTLLKGFPAPGKQQPSEASPGLAHTEAAANVAQENVAPHSHPKLAKELGSISHMVLVLQESKLQYGGGYHGEGHRVMEVCVTFPERR